MRCAMCKKDIRLKKVTGNTDEYFCMKCSKGATEKVDTNKTIYYLLYLDNNSCVFNNLNRAKEELDILLREDLKDDEMKQITSEIGNIYETDKEKILYECEGGARFKIESKLFSDKEIEELPEFTGW